MAFACGTCLHVRFMHSVRAYAECICIYMCVWGQLPLPPYRWGLAHTDAPMCATALPVCGCMFRPHLTPSPPGIMAHSPTSPGTGQENTSRTPPPCCPHTSTHVPLGRRVAAAGVGLRCGPGWAAGAARPVAAPTPQPRTSSLWWGRWTAVKVGGRVRWAARVGSRDSSSLWWVMMVAVKVGSWHEGGRPH